MKSLADLINLPRQSEASKKITQQSGDDASEPREKSDVPGVTKKIHKFRRVDFKNADLTYIGLPKKLTPSDRCKRRYAVRVEFKDIQTGAAKSKLVLFGREGKEGYVDHKNLIRRENCITKLKHTENFLHPNFYDLYILNGKRDTVKDNYIALVDALELI